MTTHIIDRRTFVKAIGAGALLASSGVATAAAEKTRFKTHATGDEEVPTPVDTNAQGQANFKLSKDGSEMSFKVNVANIDDVIGIHIHQAPAGSNGPIVVPLLGNPFITTPLTVNGTIVEGTITASDLAGPLAGTSLSALVAEIRAGNTYLNVHTSDYPGGEIRGQIG